MARRRVIRPVQPAHAVEFDLTLLISRRVPALRQWAIDTKTGIDHGTIRFADIEAFIDELHAKADDLLDTEPVTLAPRAAAAADASSRE